MLGSQHMTYPTEEQKVQAHSTYPGMAYFACTGPSDKTCGDCAFRGYRRETRNLTWSEKNQEFVVKTYRTYGCKKFKELSGHHGPKVPKEARACRYFEAKARK